MTLWGPTHLLLIGGASFSLIGLWILLIEGQQAMGSERQTTAFGRFREVLLALHPAGGSWWRRIHCLVPTVGNGARAA